MYGAEASTHHVETSPRLKSNDAGIDAYGHHKRKSKSNRSHAHHDAVDQVGMHGADPPRPNTSSRRRSVHTSDSRAVHSGESHAIHGRRRRKSHKYSSATQRTEERSEAPDTIESGYVSEPSRTIRRKHSTYSRVARNTPQSRVSLPAEQDKHRVRSKHSGKSHRSHHMSPPPSAHRTKDSAPNVVDAAQYSPERDLRSCLKKTTSSHLATTGDVKSTPTRTRKKHRHRHHKLPHIIAPQNEVDGPHEMRRSQQPPTQERLVIRNEKIRCASITVISAGNDVFMKRLYTQLLLHLQNNDQLPKKNFIFSPFSTNACLAHILSTATGLTAAQIRHALALPDQNETLHRGYANTMNGLREACVGSATRMAYHIYRQEDPHDEFSHDAAPVQLKEMNPWVSEQTQHALPLLLDKNALIVASVIHFTGMWAKRFSPNDTIKNARFVTPHMKEVRMDLMRIQDDFAQIELKELHATALEIPYANHHVSMIVLLPNDPRGFLQMEEKVCDPTFDFREAFRAAHFTELRRTDVALPSFKIGVVHDFSGPLTNMGLESVFDRSTSNLCVGGTGAGSSGVHVGCVLQRTLFEVDEEGAEQPPTRLRDPMIPRFSCHHAFMFFVKVRRTDLVLFAGRIVGENKSVDSVGRHRTSTSSSSRKK